MGTAIFPTLKGLEWPATRTPIFKTLAQQSASGDEVRASLWSLPRWQWTLSFNFLRDNSNNEFRTLVGFFLARRGSFDSFLFDDLTDESVVGQPIGTGDGSTTSFQLVRSFQGFTEPVFNTKGTSTIYKNGVVVPSANWSVTTGVLTFTAAPASGAVITGDFGYRWPVRFVSDQYDFGYFMDKLWEQKQLDFISVKNWP